MKILIASAANSIHTVRWVNALSAKGIDTTLVYLSNHEAGENKISDNVKLIKMKARGSLGYFNGGAELRKIYEAGSYNFVHAHFASGYGTLVRMSKIKPAILSVWGTDIYGFPKKSPLHRFIMKKNLFYYDRITSTSEVMKVETLNQFPNLKIDVVPFGVDTDKFQRKNVLAINDDIHLGLVKTYLHRYGIEYLIKAMAIVVKHYQFEKEVHLDVYGKGPDKEHYLNLIDELELQNHVTIHGYIANDDLPGLLEKFDLYVVPSLEESFGVSAIEAMAMGIPLVTSDADGLKEVVRHGIDGLVVPKANEHELAKAIVELIDNASLRKKMSLAVRERVELLYNWDDNVDSMIKIYQEVSII